MRFDTCAIRPIAWRTSTRSWRRSQRIESATRLRALRSDALVRGRGYPRARVLAQLQQALAQRRSAHRPDGAGSSGQTQDGQPPFTWEASASDALSFQGFDKWKDWSISGTLFKLEGYNGFGYRDHHPDVPSPYLWSFSNHYTRGKYVADGTFSPTAVSAQCGVAVLLRRMAEKNLIVFGDVPKAKGPILRYGPKVITEEGKQLQRFLERLPGNRPPRRRPARRRDSDAFKQLTGRFLAGDPARSRRRSEPSAPAPPLPRSREDHKHAQPFVRLR